ncbi:uncharacterized protein K444DRAFT_614309 [Hyaloscypha bicolor E]|uniref:Uncharacterized protein n=1 Tax=Hyaloscypha bicolor E TaxID=1095630 RepID=A0A2J6T697_9HELO|nr:uncharacterized protein K444DRAFT_614309 [Hyaloscypha bicolor E]PMD58545.1 hypothetical protein K444DRAFT_614309 [Hyaloscypha bicolor E]
MKRKAAFVEEEGLETGEAVLGTESSASIFLPPGQSSERRKTWRRSGSDFVSDLESTHLGTVLNVVEQSKNEGGLLTVVAGEHEDNAEVWEECKNAGTKFRLFALKDSIINGETKTYVVREILLSKEGGDLDRENPNIIIGQRKFSPNGRIRLEAHRLFFRGRPDIDRPYIFPKLGDEIPGVGCPDLHCTFRAIRDWETVVKCADFAGCDRNVTVEISANDARSGKVIVFDIERDELVPLAAKPTVGVMISCADFEPLYKRLDSSVEGNEKVYLSPSSKKRRMGDREDDEANTATTIELKLIGMGPQIENHRLRADLNINLVLKH